MSRTRAVTLGLLLTAGWASARPSGGSGRADPRTSTVERALQIYSLRPARRHPSERVSIHGRRVTVQVWRPVARDGDEALKTRAVQWLVLGRTRGAAGARGIFEALPEVDEITLVFNEISRPAGGRGARHRDRVRPYLRLRLSRARALSLATAPVRACVERGGCGALFASAFDEAWFEGRGVARRRRARR